MERLFALGRWLFVLSFSFYVFLHLALPDVGVKRYVPAFLPFPYFWNYFTGAALLAFILSGISGKLDRLAALLLAVYLFLVAALIHMPHASDPMELLNVFRVTNMIGGALMYAAYARDKRLSW